MTEYWFARRFPVGQSRNSLSPINDKGWAVVRTYLAFMVGGAVAAILLALVGLLWVPYLWILAPFAFMGATAYGGYHFISQAYVHGDTQHTVDDYRGGNIAPAAGATSFGTGPTSWRPPSIHQHFAESDGYWFARYRVKPQGRGLVAISWQGYAVIVGFILGMLLGGLCFLLLALLAHQFVLGAVIFGLFALVGGGTFVWAGTTKSDPERTVADYQATGVIK